MNEEGPVTSVWKGIFYQLQQEAPKPVAVLCHIDHPKRPPQYGREYHGPISRTDADALLAGVSGRYLIRHSWRGDQEYTLAIVYDGVTKNFKLYYEDGLHFVGEKRFESVDDLVADGLIFFHVETRGADLLASLTKANYEESPYYQARYYTLKSGSLLRAQAKRDSRILHHHSLRRESNASGGSAGSVERGSGGSGSERGSLERHHHSTNSSHIPQRGIDTSSFTNNYLATGMMNMGTSTLTSVGTTYTSSSSEMPCSPAASPAHQISSDVITSITPAVVENLSPAHRSDRSYNHDSIDVRDFEKVHNFKTHNFKGLHWCDYCTHFLWGLIAQGVKCSDCGFKAHRKCSERVPPDCLPDMNYVKRCFGVDLTTLLKAQNRLVPCVIERCLEELERRGLDNEGLYRVAGLHDDVETIKLLFDKDPDSVDISESSYEDINTISSVVKAYLRQLPIPLVTYNSYSQFLNAVRDDLSDSQKIVLLQQSLAVLPPAHYQTLKYFMAHLNKVADYQRINMMSPENLAIVLAPTLMRSPDPDPLKSLAAAKFERAVVEHCIHDYHQLFQP